MTAEPINLVLEILREMRRDMADMRDNLRDHTLRLNDIASGMAAMRRDQANDAEVNAHLAARVDRLRDEVDRIKRRLELAE